MTKTQKVVALAVAAASAAALLLSGPEPALDANQKCFEDEACWNCETMGNELCGPQATYEVGP